MSIEVALTKGYTALIDEIDADLAVLKWTAKTNKRNVYAMRSIGDYRIKPAKNIGMHQIILERILGRPLENGELPDHKNCNSLDNTRSNIRLANQTQNHANQRLSSRNTSGYKGVTYFKRTGRWVAKIKKNRVTKCLGYYDTPEEAAIAYNIAAIDLFGEFARLNEV